MVMCQNLDFVERFMQVKTLFRQRQYELDDRSKWVRFSLEFVVEYADFPLFAAKSRI